MKKLSEGKKPTLTPKPVFRVKEGDYINGLGMVFEITRVPGWSIFKFAGGMETGYQSWQSVHVVIWQ